MRFKERSGLKPALLLISTLTVMSGAVIAPALPSLARAFAEHEHAELLARLVLTIPALFIAFFSPFAGWLIDRYGKLRILQAAMVLYAGAGTAGFYLSDIYLLLVSRAFLGLSVAVVMTCATALAGDYFEGKARNQFLGIQNAVMALSATVYIALSGLLADFNWRYSFLIYGFSLPFLLAVRYYLHEPEIEKPDRSLDPGKALPLRTKGIVALVYLLTFLGMVLFYMVPVQTPFLFEAMGVTQPSRQGIGLMGVTLFAAFMASQYGLMKRLASFSRIYAFNFLIMGVGYWMVTQFSSFWGIVFGLVVSGFGAGLFMPNAATWLMHVAPAEMRGRIVGGMTSVVFLGQFLSPILTEPLVQATSLIDAFFWTGTAMTAIGLIFLLPFRWAQD